MSGDFDIYIQTIKRLNPKVTQQELDFFESGFTLNVLNAKAVFIQAGSSHHHLGFVTRGLIRGYYVNEMGEEITIIFVREGEWATDYPSLLTGNPSRYHFQCLEPTTIITVPYLHIQKGYDQFIGFCRRSSQTAATPH